MWFSSNIVSSQKVTATYVEERTEELITETDFIIIIIKIKKKITVEH